MTTHAAAPSLRQRIDDLIYQFVPDRVEALVEAIYSVLIVMTFTLGVSLLSAVYLAPGEEQSAWITNLFWEAFGSAAAWGLIDSFMYLISSLFARGELMRRFRSLRAARNEVEGMELVSDELEEMIELIPGAPEREQIIRSVYRALVTGKGQPASGIGLRQADFTGAAGTFLVAVLAALPVALPLLLLQLAEPPLSARWIIRIANLVGCAMLFMLGYHWARSAGAHPWRIGLLLALAGLALMTLTVPLGA